VLVTQDTSTSAVVVDLTTPTAPVARPLTGVPGPMFGAVAYGDRHAVIKGTDRLYVIAHGLNRPPLAPTLITPAVGEVIARTQAQTFRVAFNDPDPGDSMSALAIQYRPVGSSSWTG